MFAAEHPSQTLLQGLGSDVASLSHGERKVPQSHRRVWFWFQIFPRSIKSFLPALGLDLETTPILCSPTVWDHCLHATGYSFLQILPLNPPSPQKREAITKPKKHIQAQMHRYIQTHISSGPLSNLHCSFFIALQSFCSCWSSLWFQYLRQGWSAQNLLLNFGSLSILCLDLWKLEVSTN